MIEEKIKYLAKKILKFRQNGFALLYALLLTGAVLSVGVILMNIITKQLIFSSINRSSEVSYYYAANSGRECLADAITKGLFIDNTGLDTSTVDSLTISCFGQNIVLNNDDDVFSSIGIVFEDLKVDLVVYVNTDCIDKNGLPECDPNSPDMREKHQYVAIATGYSGSGGPRSTKRSAPFVVK